MCVRWARDVESLSKKIEEQQFFLLHTPDHSQPTICLVDLVDSFLRWLSAPAPRSGKSLCPADVACSGTRERGTWGMTVGVSKTFGLRGYQNIWATRLPQARWMVYFMENPNHKMDDLGYPYFRKPP